MKNTFKKMLAAALATGAIAAVCTAADPEVAWRESLRTVVGTNGLAVKSDTNATTVATQHTPAYKGQLLFGSAGSGTNALWVARGTTTNDWQQIKP